MGVVASPHSHSLPVSGLPAGPAVPGASRTPGVRAHSVGSGFMLTVTGPWRSPVGSDLGHSWQPAPPRTSGFCPLPACPGSSRDPSCISSVPSRSELPFAPLTRQSDGTGVQRRPRGHEARGPRWLLGPGRGARMLTGDGFLVAHALIKAAAELLAAVPGDVVVTDVIQRNVTHCKADTQRCQEPQPVAGGTPRLALGGGGDVFN